MDSTKGWQSLPRVNLEPGLSDFLTSPDRYSKTDPIEPTATNRRQQIHCSKATRNRTGSRTMTLAPAEVIHFGELRAGSVSSAEEIDRRPRLSQPMDRVDSDPEDSPELTLRRTASIVHRLLARTETQPADLKRWTPEHGHHQQRQISARPRRRSAGNSLPDPQRKRGGETS